MANDSVKQTILVALGVCLICSLLVSTIAVTLNARQAENQRLERVQNILAAGDIDPGDADPLSIYEKRIEPVMIELESGEEVGEEKYDDVLNIETFDIDVWANHPEYGVAIPEDDDMADIKRRPKYMVVYQVKSGEQLDKLILPIYGKGLWSTLYGFIALRSDLETVAGITFYQHKETPGLGGEVDNPAWKSRWPGKQAFDENGEVIIQVLKGAVEPSNPASSHQVDGLSGATITTRGVHNLVRYWLGDNGYGPYLRQLQEAT